MAESFEDEHVESALEQIGFVLRHYRYLANLVIPRIAKYTKQRCLECQSVQVVGEVETIFVTSGFRVIRGISWIVLSEPKQTIHESHETHERLRMDRSACYFPSAAFLSSAMSSFFIFITACIILCVFALSPL